jgi:hypothetical protein
MLIVLKNLTFDTARQSSLPRCNPLCPDSRVRRCRGKVVDYSIRGLGAVGAKWSTIRIAPKNRVKEDSPHQTQFSAQDTYCDVRETLYYQSMQTRVVLHHRANSSCRIAQNPIASGLSTSPPRTAYLHNPGRAGVKLSAGEALCYQSIKSRVVLPHGKGLSGRIAFEPVSAVR